MTPSGKVRYTARAYTIGGREGGTLRTDDGRLDVRTTDPGSPGSGTNPEQLFAAAWSTCFLSAIKVAARQRRVALPARLAIDAEVDLLAHRGDYHLQARINVDLPGVDHAIAKALVEAAHQICPYSKAVHGNIPVTLAVVSTAEELRL